MDTLPREDFSMAQRRRICCRLALLATLLLGQPAAPGARRLADAAELKIKLTNGLELRGVPTDLETMVVKPPKKNVDPDAIINYPVLMITNSLKRYFIPTRRRDEINKDVVLSRHEGFKLKQIKQKGSGFVIQAVQGFVEKPGPFDAFGRRTVILNTASGETPVIQGVTEITPQCLKITALNFSWDTAMATTSVPVDVLDAMLKNASVTRMNDSDDRLKIARFYIEAELYEQARRELEEIERDFPTLGPMISQVKIRLTQAVAQEILSELKLRAAAGQHQFVYEASKSFPIENVEAPLLREVREITNEYEQARERGEQMLAQLGELQGLLKNDPRVKEIAPLRAELAEKLDYSGLNRLDAFAKFAADPQLKPEEKLALALSGWVAGGANAVTVIDQTLRMWQARFLALEYLRTAPAADLERKAILAKLEALEGVGPERIAQMIPLLPPVLDLAGAVPEGTVRIQVAGSNEGPPVAYWVSLPYEYHPNHVYPVLIALHSERGSPQQELVGFWSGPEGRGGQSQRQGYIAIAPEYIAKGSEKGYDYGAASHQMVLDSLRDARQRFNVDSDRVFLTGHGMGADAAWDMGLSHPHLFAGVIPISGAIDRYAKPYIDNARELPLFAVNGALDRDLIARNVLLLQKMMDKNFDLIYCEYRGCGPESFYAEIHMFFDWMSKLRRPAPPKEVTAKTLRESDNRFSWLEFSGVPDNIKKVNWANDKQPPHPLTVTARITPGNTINVTARTTHQRLWLARGEGLIDFQKKLKVDVNGRNKFNDFIKPDVGVMLEHVRLTGDRQRLYWAMLEF